MTCFIFLFIIVVLFVLTESGARNSKVASKYSLLSKRQAFGNNRLAASTRIEKSETALVTAKATEGPAQPFYMRVLPIFPKELKKFFSLSFMMFWIVFVFTMTRDTKDALIVTNCGAESIAFLKVYGVIPAAVSFMVIYSALARRLSHSHLFYAILLPFFVFYAAFAFILYPLRNILHPTHWALPNNGFSFAVNLLRYWIFSLYYIVSELWGSAGVPLLFWSCANDVVVIDQAKRLYPLMSLIGNLGPILSGVTMAMVSAFVAKNVHNDEAAFELSLKILTGIMMGAGMIVMVLHNFVRNIHAEEVRDMRASAVASFNTCTTPLTSIKPPIHVKHNKPSLSVWQSIKVLASNTYLLNIATMVLSYGLSIEFTEIIWKAAVKAALPEKTEYLSFMGRYSTLVGSMAFIMMFVGARIVRMMGWRAGALTTPLMMGVLAAPFFFILTFGDVKNNPKNLLWAVYIGLFQNVVSKATKYAIFDPTKEISYIPLDSESKTSGKAAIDVLGARLGKSGGAFAQQMLVVICGSIFSCAPYLSAMFYITIILWTSKLTCY
ncbi:NTP/NDP exchange transporter [archaeon]|nr:MAG: NTP/NDP exchange transporter [archaeon]